MKFGKLELFKTAYAVLCGGTASPGEVQSSPPVALGYVLTDNGPGALPTMQAVTVPDASVSQAKLKTNTGEVSTVSVTMAVLTLPGGQYGFWPETKVAAGKQGCATVGFSPNSPFAFTHSSYTAVITLWCYTSATTTYAQQRYVSASGPDHWIFLLVAKKDFVERDVQRRGGEVLSVYQAPDHPCANNGRATPDKISHPFPCYDPSLHEIVIVDNDILPDLKKLYEDSDSDSMIDVLLENFMLDDSNPIFAPRRIHKINEKPSKPVGTVLKRMKTPEWAQTVLSAEEITIEEIVVAKLPPHIKYRRMVKK